MLRGTAIWSEQLPLRSLPGRQLPLLLLRTLIAQPTSLARADRVFSARSTPEESQVSRFLACAIEGAGWEQSRLLRRGTCLSPNTTTKTTATGNRIELSY
jgi:hypothetical protein